MFNKVNLSLQRTSSYQKEDFSDSSAVAIAGKERKITLSPMQIPTLYLPSFLNIIIVPIDLAQYTISWIKADLKGDTEGQIDASLKLSSMPFTLTHSGLSLISYVFTIGSFFERSWSKILPAASPLFSLIPIVGSVSCFIELVAESVAVRRQLELLQDKTLTLWKKLPQNLAEDSVLTTTSELLGKSITDLHSRYFTLSVEEERHIDKIAQKTKETKASLQERVLTIKKKRLARRIHTWLVEKLAKEIPSLLQDLKTPRLRKWACIKAQELLQHVNTQALKKLLIHIIGIITIILSTAALILSALACPPSIPLVLFAFASLFAFARYLLTYGLLEVPGWQFSWTHCLPDFLRSKIESIQESPLPALSPPASP